MNEGVSSGETGDSKEDGENVPSNTESFTGQERSLPAFHDLLPILERNDSMETMTYQSTNALSSHHGYKEIEDPHAVAGRCGLYNLGNTCFLNSGIQCVASTSPLMKFFLERFILKDDVKETLTGKLYQLLCKVWSGKYSVLHPQYFKNILGIYHSQFQDYRQHDSQEFLALLLGTLHEQLNIKSGSTILCQNTNGNSRNNKLAEDVPVSETEQRMNNSFDELFGEIDQTWAFQNMNTHCSSDKRMRNSFENSTEKNDQNSTSLNSENISNSFLDNHRNVEFPILNNENEQSSAIHDNLDTRDQSEPLVFNEMDPVVKMIQSNDVIHNSSNLRAVDARKKDTLNKERELLTKESVFEDSNQSAVSNQSSDSDQCTVMSKLKLHPPESNKLLEAEPLNSDTAAVFDENVEQLGNECGMLDENIQETFQEQPNSRNFEINDEQRTVEGKHSEELLLNNMVSQSSLPSFIDLYEKESKTLNVNVLATEYMHELVTLDSEKFAKPDNIDHSQENVNLLSESFAAESVKDYQPMGSIKDTNIRAEKKSRLSQLCASCCAETSHSEDCCNIHSIKKMKYEGTEKNLQMQALSKINKNKILLKKENVNLKSVSNDVELDQDIDMENSDDEDEDNDGEDEEASSESNAVDERSVEPYTEADVEAAMKAWRTYTDQNDSVIVSAFQGQFKSTVVCSECHYLSVTYEPFMYLTLPLPHAMEKQLCVIFVPSHLPPVRYLLNMHKNDNIRKVKRELQIVAHLENCDLIMAEILDCHISRILDDNVLLRFINDSARKIYGFEMLPPPSFSVDQNNVIDVASNTKSPKDNEFSGANFISNAVSNETDIFNNMGTFSMTTLSYVPDIESSYKMADRLLDADSAINEFDMKHLFEPNTCDSVKQTEIVGYHTSCDLPSEKGDSACLELMGFPKQPYPDTIGTGLWEWGGIAEPSEVGEAALPEWGGVDAIIEDTREETVAESSPSVVEQWKSCAICLEELPDTELLVHTSCSGTFCPSCLEMSFKHYGDADFSCPVCSSPASMTEDFIPVASVSGHKPKTRILAVPITYRCEIEEDGWKTSKLFGCPNVWYLPSNLTGQQLYEYMNRRVPFLTTYTIVLTDGQGLHCSRCLYTEHCSGCALSRQEDISLRPGDHLTIVVTDITSDQIEAAQKCQNHKSMEKLRPDEPISIYDCFRSFTESEVLDEHNPWYCPRCRENQGAKKTMTVWQYPDTLIVHLKRFVFYDMSSTKIDNKVVFPMESLDLGDIISGPRTKDLRYNLYSIVCHFGGANAGHYTSYAKHPLDKEWYYFNDETVSHQAPREEDYSSAYVLFYQRQDTDVVFNVPENLPLEDGVILPEISSPVSITVGLGQPTHVKDGSEELMEDDKKLEI